MLKKLALAVFAMLAVSSAQAAFIQCTSARADVVINAAGTTASFDCNPGAGAGAGSADDNLAADGWDVTGISLRLSGAFEQNAALNNAYYAVDFQMANGMGFTNASCLAEGYGNGVTATGNCTSTRALLSLAATDVISASTVTVTGDAGSVPLPVTASASVLYEDRAVQRPVQQVPEPATLGIAALALLGLATLRRRT